MESIVKNLIEIERAKTSKIDQVDFDNLAFGSIFTDHMLVCDYKNGAWQTPKIVPHGPIELEPTAKIFHYGQSIFEGMKAYKDADGAAWLFRPLDNHKRLNVSAKRMAIPRISGRILYGRIKNSFRIRQRLDSHNGRKLDVHTSLYFRFRNRFARFTC